MIKNTKPSKALVKTAVISRFVGVYSPEDNLLKICKTKKRAMYERDIYESQHGEGFYLDRVWLFP
jgi:hypothetical protein